MWNAQPSKHFLVPFQLADIEDHRTRRIGIVGHVNLPFCHIPNQPSVNGAEEEVPCFGFFFCPFYIFEDPVDLGRREVGVNDQTSGLFDMVDHAFIF